MIGGINLWVRLIKTGNRVLIALGLLALWGAAGASVWSAMEAKRTADTIAKMELERLNYERDRYTAEIVYRNAEFVAKTHPLYPCTLALNALDESTDLRALFEEPSNFRLDLENQKHTELLRACLDPDIARGVIEKSISWTADHRRKIRGLVIDWANQLDAVMSAFIYGVANQYILCRNLEYFTVRTPPTQTKLLFVKIKKMGIWNGLPNLWEFMDRYPEPPGCEGFPGKPTMLGPVTVTAGIGQK
jgi:hypothetical protein